MAQSFLIINSFLKSKISKNAPLIPGACITDFEIEGFFLAYPLEEVLGFRGSVGKKVAMKKTFLRNVRTLAAELWPSVF